MRVERFCKLFVLQMNLFDLMQTSPYFPCLLQMKVMNPWYVQSEKEILHELVNLWVLIAASIAAELNLCWYNCSNDSHSSTLSFSRSWIKISFSLHLCQYSSYWISSKQLSFTLSSPPLIQHHQFLLEVFLFFAMRTFSKLVQWDVFSSNRRNSVECLLDFVASVFDAGIDMDVDMEWLRWLWMMLIKMVMEAMVRTWNWRCWTCCGHDWWSCLLLLA